jgi:tRNA A37 threonylcarbamoyladenosine synthetase subunit TsaC/SUA5/YrdC
MMRARVMRFIQRTFWSSPLSIANPEGDSIETIFAFSERVAFRVPKDRLCSLAIDVTTVMLGRSAYAYNAISPGFDTPTSITALRCHGRI